MWVFVLHLVGKVLSGSHHQEQTWRYWSRTRTLIGWQKHGFQKTTSSSRRRSTRLCARSSPRRAFAVNSRVPADVIAGAPLRTYPGGASVSLLSSLAKQRWRKAAPGSKAYVAPPVLVPSS